MPNTRHYLNGSQVEEPRNWQDLEITMDWSKSKIDFTINLDSLEFAGQTATTIIANLDQNGYFQGQRYRIDVGTQLNPVLQFNGYLDATQAPVIKAPNIIEIALKKEQGTDWLVEVADSFSFRFLASTDYTGVGSITNPDYTGVPYVINYIPDGVELLLLSMSLFMITKELVESIQSIAKQTTDIIEGVTPVISTDVPVGLSTGWNLGKIIGSIINLALTVAYTIGVMFALVKLIEEIIEQLAPLKRFHLGMRIKLLAQRACEYLNLTLDSDLLDGLDVSSEQWVIIPSKGHKGGSPPTGTDPNTWIELGVPNASDGIDTFGDLIRFIRTTWNADYQIKDGIFKIERKDFKQNIASFTIPDTLTNQEELRNEFTPNTDEIRANVVIVWDTDQQDKNTLDNQNGRVFQVVTTVKAVQDPELVNIKGLNRISIPMSLAIRKNKLTDFEEALKLFLQAGDFLSGQLDQPNSFASQFNARIGSMHLSSHFLTRPKMVVMAGSTLALDQRNKMSAERLWNEYHFIDSFVTVDGKNNQQVIFKEQKIPFCFESFVFLSNNNFCTNSDGEQVEIMNLVWTVEENFAIVTYRVYRVYDTNLELTFIRE